MILKRFFNNTNILLKEKFDLIIFSEGEHYQKIYYDIIKKLKSKIKILYLTIDKSERLDLDNIKFINIGSGLKRQLYLNLLSGKIFLTTTPDIGNNEILISKKISKYFYIFHSAASTHKLYNENAFDNFDVIMANGNYQINELKNLEVANSSKRKSFLKTGYVYFDYLYQNKSKEMNNKILIAPSWNNNKNNFTSNICENLISNLLSNDYQVIFRPHPEQIKREADLIKKIKFLFKENKNFDLDTERSNLNSLNQSKMLITDNSAIAIEFLLILKKPVLYMNYQDKLNNFNHNKINNEKLEDTVKSKFGFSLNLERKNFNNINNLILECEREFEKQKIKIDDFLINNFFNFGKVADKAATQIIDFLDHQD
tara:strand:+ start:4030 stop:5139 length:1110 start_codon:yes stop_codon:yes gene_type:complete